MEATITYEDEKPVKAEGFLKIAAVLKPGYIVSLDLSKYKLTYEMLFTLCLHLSEGIQVEQLNIGNNKELEAAAYEKVVEIIQKTKVTQLVLANCDLNKEKLQVLQRSLKRKNIKLELLALSENKGMKASDFQIIADLFKNARIDGLALWDCDLTSEKLSAFLGYSTGKTFKVSKLEINKNKSMKPEAYSKLAEFIQKMKVEQLMMKDCALDKEKLKAFHDALRGRRGWLSHLSLDENKTMEAEEFEQIVGVCQLADVETLSLVNCDLNHMKLSSFNKHLSGKNVKIPCLKLGKNRKMESAAYREVAEIVVRANVAELWLDDCNLDEEKLDKFCKSLEGRYITLSSLMLNENKSIMPQGFRCIGEILKHVEIETLRLCDCALTVDKLRSFREGLGTKVHIYRLDLSSNRYMEAACYREIPDCVEAAKVNKLWLKNCDLNGRKLNAFHDSLKGRNIKSLALILDENKSIGVDGFQCIGKILEDFECEVLSLGDCALTSDKLRVLHEAITGNTKITGLDVSNNRQMGAACYLEVVHFIEKAKVDKLWMNNCNLDERKLSVFQSSLKGKNIKMEYLILNQNGSIEPAGFKHIAEAFVNADIEGLALWDCELTLKKLQAFNSSLQGKDVKISKLELTDNKHMEPAAYGEVVTLIQRAKVDVLCLNRCNLSKEKLSAFQKGLKEKNVKAKLNALLLNQNKAIEPEGFEYIADICLNMGVGELLLADCALTPAKLSTFSKHIHEKNAKIPRLDLSINKNMEPDTYHELADVVQAAQVDFLWLHNCNLNSEKLEAFAKGLKGRNVKIPKLSLEENKAMESEAYHELAGIIQAAQVQDLWLDNCDLNKEKLQAFQKGFEGKNIQLTQLSVGNNKGMETAAYEEIPGIARKSGVTILVMDNCDLDEDKLAAFSEAVRGVEIPCISLSRNKTTGLPCFKLIADIVVNAQTKTLQLSNCDLTVEKLHAIGKVLVENNVKVLQLDITNNKSIDPEFEEVKDIIHKMKVATLISDKDKKTSNKMTPQHSGQGRGTAMASMEDFSISSLRYFDREIEAADSGRASSIQSSTDFLSERGTEKVANWLEKQGEDALSKDESVAEKALKLSEKSQVGHAAELADFVSTLKDQELSCDELISISKDQMDKSATFILTECVAKVLPSELGAQHGAVSEKLLFIENALDELSDDLRLQLLVNCSPDIYQVYLALGKYKEAVGICQRGISLIQKKTGPNNQYFGILGKLEHNIGFAYACQHNMVAARGHYLQALDHYNEAKKIGEDTEQDKTLLESRLDEVHKILFSRLPYANHHEVQAYVRAEGDIISVGDCVIDFPKGALPRNTDVLVSLSTNAADIPHGLVPIAPVIQLTPCMELNEWATIKVPTWCINKSGGTAFLYYKKMGNSKWVEIQTLQIGQAQVLEFQVKQFCYFCLVAPIDPTNEFVIQSSLFCNAIGQLSNFVIPRCRVKNEEIIMDMADRSHKFARVSSVSLNAKINSKVEVTIQPAEGEEARFDPQTLSWNITEQLMKGIGEIEQTYLLPKTFKGKIDLKQRIRLEQAGVAPTTIDRQDRISLEHFMSFGHGPMNLAAIQANFGGSSGNLNATDSHFVARAGGQ